MKTEEIIKRLRNPQKYRKPQNTASQPDTDTDEKLTPVKTPSRKMGLETIVGCAVIVLFFITLLFWVMSKHRAENLTAALDPDQVKGLVLDEAEFNPYTGVTYVEVREGQDRNVAVSNLGSTLPIISRFNFKTLTDKNYEVIGAAPWALTTNFDSNISDPEIIAYLLSNDVMIQAFITRPDVEPLLDDPQLLRAFLEDQKALEEFFASDTVKNVLASPQMVRTVLGSRFASYLLISKSGKYWRNHAQEAAQIINQTPSLAALRDNVGVITAVKENPYLKQHATILLAKPVSPAPAASAKPKTATPAKGKGKSSKKK